MVISTSKSGDASPGQIDAPSGTALMLGEAAAAGRKIALDQHSARDATHHRRAPVRRHLALRHCAAARHRRHSVIFGSAMERIELTHRARIARCSPRAPSKPRCGRGDKSLDSIQWRRARAGEFEIWRFLEIETEIKRMSGSSSVLVRHGQSEWEPEEPFHRLEGSRLTRRASPRRRKPARTEGAGAVVRHRVYLVLTRAQHTLDLMLTEIGQTGSSRQKHLALTSAITATSRASTRTTPAEMGRGAGPCLARSYDVPPPTVRA